MSDAGAQPPGWYYAAGDPPGTQRYWDGELWQGQPVQVAQPPPQPYQQYRQYPEASQSTTALVLSICGLVVCGILGPIGWNIAQKELNGIDAGRRDPSNRGTAQAAKVIGIIVTVLMAIGILILILIIAGAGFASI